MRLSYVLCPDMTWLAILLAVASSLLAGCGTSTFTDTRRTATEQLLISDSMDRAVSKLDFSALAGKTVYLDDAPIKGVTDAAYLSSALRQHLLASGCILRENKNEADYIVEVRAGAVGTDRHDVMYGIPSLNVPAFITTSVADIPARVPEMPLIRKTQQRAVTKIAVFAYNRKTGRPVWQSGSVPVESVARAVWVLGAGPFLSGDIYEGTELAGDKISIPLVDFFDASGRASQRVSVAQEAFFVEPETVADRKQPASVQVAQRSGEKATQSASGADKQQPPEQSPAKSNGTQAVPTAPSKAETNATTPPKPQAATAGNKAPAIPTVPFPEYPHLPTPVQNGAGGALAFPQP